MNVTERLQLLTTLLERVRRNASRSRSVQPAPPPGDGARAVVAPSLPVAEEVHSVVVASTPEAIEAPIAAAALGSEPPVSEERIASTAPVDLSAAPLEDTPDLLEEDIVDITLEEPVEEVNPAASAQAAGAGGVADVDIDFDEQEDQPPSSSRRPIVTADALDVAAEREVPLKTPPPESGPQEAVPPAHVLQQPPPPIDLEERAALEDRAKAAPREEARSPALELEPLSPAAPQKGAVEELELELPPPAAAAPAHAAPSVQPALRAPSVQPARPAVEPAPAVEEAPVKPVVPDVAARPAIAAATPAARFAEAHRSFAPRSFMELLDAALALEA